MYVCHIHMKQSKTLRGPPCTSSFFIPYSLFFRKWASFTFLGFPWVPKDRFKQLLIRKGRESRNNGGTNKKPKCSLGRVLVHPQEIYRIVSLSSSAELRPPATWRMVTSGRAQESWSTTLLLTPQHQPIRRKSHTLLPSPQILSIIYMQTFMHDTFQYTTHTNICTAWTLNQLLLRAKTYVHSLRESRLLSSGWSPSIPSIHQGPSREQKSP